MPWTGIADGSSIGSTFCLEQAANRHLITELWSDGAIALCAVLRYLLPSPTYLARGGSTALGLLQKGIIENRAHRKTAYGRGRDRAGRDDNDDGGGGCCRQPLLSHCGYRTRGHVVEIGGCQGVRHTGDGYVVAIQGD